MEKSGYERYLELFNSKNYDGVLDHFNDDCEVSFAGYSFRGKDAIRNFYAFFHGCVIETIKIDRYIHLDDTVAIEALVRLEGLRPVSRADLEGRGLDRLMIPEPGQVIEIPQFIHYHLKNGKFSKALCAVFEAPRTIIS